MYLLVIFNFFELRDLRVNEHVLIYVQTSVVSNYVYIFILIDYLRLEFEYIIYPTILKACMKQCSKKRKIVQ